MCHAILSKKWLLSSRAIKVAGSHGRCEVIKVSFFFFFCQRTGYPKPGIVYVMTPPPFPPLSHHLLACLPLSSMSLFIFLAIRSPRRLPLSSFAIAFICHALVSRGPHSYEDDDDEGRGDTGEGEAAQTGSIWLHEHYKKRNWMVSVFFACAIPAFGFVLSLALVVVSRGSSAYLSSSLRSTRSCFRQPPRRAAQAKPKNRNRELSIMYTLAQLLDGMISLAAVFVNSS